MDFKPPKIIKTITEFSNKYIKVITEYLLFEKDNEILNKEYYSAICEDFVVGFVIKDNKILTISQYRVPVKKINTEFVAGSIEIGESAKECIIKELREEAGIKADSPKLLGKINPLSGFTPCTGYVFIVSSFEETKQDLEIYEKFTCLTPNWVTIDEFIRLIQSNKITDGVTLAAWALFREIIGVKA